ncbi:MAG: triose-phosphate isomerase [Gemmatimonadales bacterium]
MATLFAANWKMHHGPEQAATFARAFKELTFPEPTRSIWFFPPATSIRTLALELNERPDVAIGAQDVHWEPSGAYTGALSIPLAQEAGATVALVGHSERRHLFGETDEETGRKAAALLDGGMMPLLCVGELADQRERGETEAVVRRQLDAGLVGVAEEDLPRVVIAYEPVWAIGTGKNATPDDAASVHAFLRSLVVDRRGPEDIAILYGGSVKPGNVLSFLVEDEIDGVLVGGASLTPESWTEIVGVGGGAAA